MGKNSYAVGVDDSGFTFNGGSLGGLPEEAVNESLFLMMARLLKLL